MKHSENVPSSAQARLGLRTKPEAHRAITFSRIYDNICIRCPDPKSSQVFELGSPLRDERFREELLKAGILDGLTPHAQHVATWFCNEASTGRRRRLWWLDGRPLRTLRSGLGKVKSFREWLEKLCKEEPLRRRTLCNVLKDLDEGILHTEEAIRGVNEMRRAIPTLDGQEAAKDRAAWFNKDGALAYALDRLFENYSKDEIPHGVRCERIAKFRARYSAKKVSHSRQTVENQIRRFEKKSELRQATDRLISFLLDCPWFLPQNPS